MTVVTRGKKSVFVGNNFDSVTVNETFKPAFFSSELGSWCHSKHFIVVV